MDKIWIVEVFELSGTSLVLLGYTSYELAKKVVDEYIAKNSGWEEDDKDYWINFGDGLEIVISTCKLDYPGPLQF